MTPPSDEAARISDCLREAKSVEKLADIVDILRPQIDRLPKDLKAWLRDEYRSIKWGFENAEFKRKGGG